ncbi:MAG: hypothetical protein IPI88_12070 [Chitinophagaceae bacterium]|nr:hypothetical protein [Chitinophagaceae bacterium]
MQPLYLGFETENMGMEGTLENCLSVADKILKIIITKTTAYKRFCAIRGYDVAAIIGSAYPSIGFGGRNSAGQ